MKLIIEYDKGTRCLPCVDGINCKYDWFSLLKDKNILQLLKLSKKILDESKSLKPKNVNQTKYV